MAGALQKKRGASAVESANKLAMLHTNPAVAQRVAMAVVLPNFSYGLSAQKPNKDMLARIRKAVKQAMGI